MRFSFLLFLGVFFSSFSLTDCWREGGEEKLSQIVEIHQSVLEQGSHTGEGLKTFLLGGGGTSAT